MSDDIIMFAVRFVQCRALSCCVGKKGKGKVHHRTSHKGPEGE